jgi:putative nucleotidyltransferase with HDIG domain
MIWLDWLIIASVAALAAVIYKQWKDRPRLVNKLDSPVRRIGPIAAALNDREGDRRLLKALREVPANRRFSTGTHAFACYKHKFEEITKGLGDEEASFWETLSALAFEVQARPPHGLEHFQGVSRLASKIASQLGLSDQEVEEIRVAGIVHDIGKSQIPEQVRLKADVLTADEFEIMKGHADWGARMLEPLNEVGIEEIVRHHHERFDGNGYPDRLKGDDIPLGARIVSVAESFDSMVSEQAYKDPRSFDDAVAEVLRCSGTQFDPEVVAAFLGRVRMEGDLHRQN